MAYRAISSNPWRSWGRRNRVFIKGIIEERFRSGSWGWSTRLINVKTVDDFRSTRRSGCSGCWTSRARCSTVTSRSGSSRFRSAGQDFSTRGNPQVVGFHIPWWLIFRKYGRNRQGWNPLFSVIVTRGFQGVCILRHLLQRNMRVRLWRNRQSLVRARFVKQSGQRWLNSGRLPGVYTAAGFSKSMPIFLI